MSYDFQKAIRVKVHEQDKILRRYSSPRPPFRLGNMNIDQSSFGNYGGELDLSIKGIIGNPEYDYIIPEMNKDIEKLADIKEAIDDISKKVLGE